MHRAMTSHVAGGDTVDAVIMAAAVADYTPASGPAGGKIEKTDAPLTVTLTRTPDILAELGRDRQTGRLPILVGFAAETGDPRPRARQKLTSKKLDLIVANDVSRTDAGFDVETNAVYLISDGEEIETPVLLKTGLASTILDKVEQLLAARVPSRAS
jgi:phosphopantothenoylcysteine decarboxylase/phosphopantothenate--cysteine ligase